MPDPTETPTPWPDWLDGLTPAERVAVIAGALDRCSSEGRCAGDGEHAPDRFAHLGRPEAERFLLRLLGEARRAGYESAFTEAMDAHRARIDQVAGPAEPAAVPSAEQPQPVAPEPVMALLETGAALVRNLSMRPGTGSSWDAMAEAWQENYRALAAEYAAGKAERAAEPAQPVPWFLAVNRADKARSVLLRAALRCLSADLDAEANPRADSDAACEYAAEQVALAARELAEATDALPDGRPVGWGDVPAGDPPPRPLPASLQPVPLLPDGTHVDVQIKGFQHCEGYLTAGSWHGERYGFLHDKDGKFVAAFPPVAGSVHLISAQPEPGSEPEQPDPWAQTIEDVRADAVVLRRNWHGDRDKLIALRAWAELFLAGDDALAEVREIFEKDFRPQEVDERALF